MPAFVESRADEVVHAGIDDLEGLGGAALLVEHLGEHESGVSDHEATGLAQDAQSERFEMRHNGVGVGLHRQRMRLRILFPPGGGAGVQALAVIDADTAADAEEFDAVALFDLLHERHDLLHRFKKRIHIGELRADVHLQAFDDEIRALGGHTGVNVEDLVEVDAKFVLALSGGDLGMRLRVHVRIHAHGHRRLFAHFARHLVDVAQFGL